MRKRYLLFNVVTRERMGIPAHCAHVVPHFPYPYYIHEGPRQTTRYYRAGALGLDLEEREARAG
jgi:hypothetical protein